MQLKKSFQTYRAKLIGFDITGENTSLPQDYILVFINPHYKGSDLSNILDKEIPSSKARKKFKKQFHLNENEKKILDSFIEALPSEDSDGTFPFREFCKQTISACCMVLQNFLGLEISMSLSSDQDQVFLLVKANEENLKIQADIIDYKLQFSEETCDLGENRDDYPFQQALPHAQFEKNQLNRSSVIGVGMSTDPERLYQKYDINGNPTRDGETFFRYVDRVRLIQSMLCSSLNLSELYKKKILSSAFPVPKSTELRYLKDHWATFRYFYKSLPLEKIRAYFGEELTLYFAWLEFYAKWLSIPAIFGTIIAIIYYASGGFHKDSALSGFCLISFSLFIALSSTLLDQMWVRREKSLAWHWGLHDYEKVEEQRSSYKGKFKKDDISGKIKKMYEPKGLEKYARLLGYGLIFVFVGIVIAALAAIFAFRKISNLAWIRELAGIINAIQIKILNIVYQIIARKMTDWENQETERKYYDSLTLKLFCFQFVNSYSSLFYIAFIKESIDGCTDGDCMFELQIQLISIFITNLVLNLVELGLPLVIGKYRLLKEINRANIAGNELREEELEALKPSFDSPLDDYMEIIICYGYLVLFGVAFPFTPLLALVLAYIEIRVDAWKLCYLIRRPFPSQDNSIRIWLEIIQMVSYIGAAINIGVIVFTANAFEIEDPNSKWICFVMFEHSLFIIKYLISAYIPDAPKKVIDGVTWSERIIREKLYGKLTDIEMEREARKLHFQPVDREKFHKFEELFT